MKLTPYLELRRQAGSLYRGDRTKENAGPSPSHATSLASGAQQQNQNRKQRNQNNNNTRRVAGAAASSSVSADAAQGQSSAVAVMTPPVQSTHTRALPPLPFVFKPPTSNSTGQTTYRLVPHPTGSTGECTRPNYGAERTPQPWTDESWARATIDFMRLDWMAIRDGKHTTLVKFAALVRPADASRNTYAGPGVPQRDPTTNRFPPDACKYCLFTPVCTNPNDPDFWKYGTGSGDHPPGTCQRAKRFIAEGGLPGQLTAEAKAFMQNCLYYPPPRINRSK